MIKKKIKATLSEEGNAVIYVLTEAYKNKNDKIISKIYQSLWSLKGNDTGHIKTKWDKGLNIQITGYLAFGVERTAFLYKLEKVEDIWLEKF